MRFLPAAIAALMYCCWHTAVLGQASPTRALVDELKANPKFQHFYSDAGRDFFLSPNRISQDENATKAPVILIQGQPETLEGITFIGVRFDISIKCSTSEYSLSNSEVVDVSLRPLARVPKADTPFQPVLAKPTHAAYALLCDQSIQSRFQSTATPQPSGTIEIDKNRRQADSVDAARKTNEEKSENAQLAKQEERSIEISIAKESAATQQIQTAGKRVAEEPLPRMVPHYTTGNTDFWRDVTWAVGSGLLMIIMLMGIFRVGAHKLLLVSAATSAADEVYKETKKAKPDLIGAALGGGISGLAIGLGMILIWPVMFYYNAIIPLFLRSDDASRTVCCIKGDSPHLALLGDAANWALADSYSRDGLFWGELGEHFQLINLHEGYVVKWPATNGSWDWAYTITRRNLLEMGSKEERNIDDGTLLHWVPKYLPIKATGVTALPPRASSSVSSLEFLTEATNVPGYSQRNWLPEGKISLYLYGPNFRIVTNSGEERIIETRPGAVCAIVASNAPIAAIVYPAESEGIAGPFSQLFGKGMGRIEIVELLTGAQLKKFNVSRFWGRNCDSGWDLLPSPDGHRWVLLQDRLVKVFDLGI